MPTYIEHVSKHVAACGAGVNNGEFKDVMAYAECKLGPELQAKLLAFEGAIEKSDRRLLSRLGVKLIDEAPTLLNPANLPMLPYKLLEILVEPLVHGWKERADGYGMPEIKYVYRMKQRL